MVYRKQKSQAAIKKKKMEEEKQLNQSKNDLDDSTNDKLDTKAKNSKKWSIRKLKKIETNVKRKFLKKVEITPTSK